jgi:predicted transcriptional regulator of viral defense system
MKVKTARQTDVSYPKNQFKPDLLDTNNNFSYVLYLYNKAQADYETMKHKLISTQSSEILTHFHALGQEWFDSSEALAALPHSSPGAVNELLSDMVRRGLLLRLKQSLYCIIPYNQDPETFMPDWHLLAEPLSNGTNHYIGYYSALQIHQLITQPSLKEQIVVAQQIKPSHLKIKDVHFQFIYHNEQHFFGSKKIWIDAYHKVWCSDLEKTLVDCAFKPEYAGGIVEVAKALALAKDRIDFDKLIDYTLQFNSQAVIKRLGFILETLNLDRGTIRLLQKLKTNSYVLLDTELPKSGKRLSRWSIQQNLETETIQSALFT